MLNGAKVCANQGGKKDGWVSQALQRRVWARNLPPFRLTTRQECFQLKTERPTFLSNRSWKLRSLRLVLSLCEWRLTQNCADYESYRYCRSCRHAHQPWAVSFYCRDILSKSLVLGRLLSILLLIGVDNLTFSQDDKRKKLMNLMKGFACIGGVIAKSFGLPITFGYVVGGPTNESFWPKRNANMNSHHRYRGWPIGVWFSRRGDTHIERDLGRPIVLFETGQKVQIVQTLASIGSIFIFFEHGMRFRVTYVTFVWINL